MYFPDSWKLYFQKLVMRFLFIWDETDYTGHNGRWNRMAIASKDSINISCGRLDALMEFTAVQSMLSSAWFIRIFWAIGQFQLICFFSAYARSSKILHFSFTCFFMYFPSSSDWDSIYCSSSLILLKEYLPRSTGTYFGS